MLKQGLTILTAMLLVLSATSTLAAERYMYKWKSADGELHYTERPPKDIPYEKIRVRNDDRTGAAAAKPGNPVANQKDQQRDDVKAADESYQTWRKDNCRIARQNLDILNTAGRISTDDGQGGKRLMTDEEKAASKKKWTAAQEKYCSPPDTEK